MKCTDEEFKDVDMFILSLEFKDQPMYKHIIVTTDSLVYMYEADDVLNKYRYVTY